MGCRAIRNRRVCVSSSDRAPAREGQTGYSVLSKVDDVVPRTLAGQLENSLSRTHRTGVMGHRASGAEFEGEECGVGGVDVGDRVEGGWVTVRIVMRLEVLVLRLDGMSDGSNGVCTEALGVIN